MADRDQNGRHPALPLWLRALIAIDSAARRFQGVISVMIQEVALAVVPEDRRAALTWAIYARRSGYVQGGGTFEQGLFEWEERAISTPPFPQSGRILLGGAGGGREIAALVARGYEIVAFEPSAPLAESAAQASAAWRGVRVITAAYADLTLALEESRGPLAAIVAGNSFDAVILGWGSLSHVLRHNDRLALFRATRALAPSAPLLLSYLGEGALVKGRRRKLRSVLARITSGSPSPDEHFLPWAGFYRALSGDELERLAADAGYKVAWKRRTPYHHALLVPVPQVPGAPEPDTPEQNPLY